MEAMKRSARTSARTVTVVILAVAGLLGPAGKAGAVPKPEPPKKWQIPTPSFTAPAPYQKFTLTPSLTVNLKANIPKLPWDFVAYAKASPFPLYSEKWHIKVGKLDPKGDQVLGDNKASGVQEFEGEIADYSFSISLNADRFTKRGPGKYGAIAYLSQTASKGISSGLATGVDFEIVPQVSDRKPADAFAKPAPGVLAAALKPMIAVTGAKPEITKNCKGPAPAFVAAITIKNSGGALAAGKGKVFLKEQGGAGLEGAADVPAFEAGQEQSVNVPATSLPAFSKLVGSHQIQVVFKPAIEGGQPAFNTPANPFAFPVVFPAGHCGATSGMAPPKPSSYAPNERTNPAELNPQPEAPSKPKEKKKKPEGEGK